MDHRINNELAQSHERELHSKPRRQWPDDGQPARHKDVRPTPPLHPASVVAELFWS